MKSANAQARSGSGRGSEHRRQGYQFELTPLHGLEFENVSGGLLVVFSEPQDCANGAWLWSRGFGQRKREGRISLDMTSSDSGGDVIQKSP